MIISCKWCGGAGCLVCDGLRELQARQDTREAVARRREAEAREFLREFLNHGEPPGSPEIIPHPRDVELAVHAIEFGRRAYLKERAEAQETLPTAARFGFIEWQKGSEEGHGEQAAATPGGVCAEARLSESSRC